MGSQISVMRTIYVATDRSWLWTGLFSCEPVYACCRILFSFRPVTVCMHINCFSYILKTNLTCVSLFKIHRLNWRSFVLFTIHTNITDKVYHLANSLIDMTAHWSVWYTAKLIVLNFTTLWANLADEKLMIFFVFFPENIIWHVMQIVSNGDNLHEMSNPVSEKK